MEAEQEDEGGASSLKGIFVTVVDEPTSRTHSSPISVSDACMPSSVTMETAQTTSAFHHGSSALPLGPQSAWQRPPLATRSFKSRFRPGSGRLPSELTELGSSVELKSSGF